MTSRPPAACEGGLDRGRAFAAQLLHQHGLAEDRSRGRRSPVAALHRRPQAHCAWTGADGVAQRTCDEEGRRGVAADRDNDEAAYTRERRRAASRDDGAHAHDESDGESHHWYLS